MENQVSILEEIEKHTNGKFVYVRDHMKPIKSFGYGHLNNESIYIEEDTKQTYKIAFKNEIIMVKKEELIKELDKYIIKFTIKNVFDTVKEKQYDNILKLAASTINPYILLKTSDKRKKIEEIFLKHNKFKNLEEVDLFLVGLGRVNKVMTFNGFGRLDINYFSTKRGHYFLIDIDTEEIIISDNTLELEIYILTKINKEKKK